MNGAPLWRMITGYLPSNPPSDTPPDASRDSLPNLSPNPARHSSSQRTRLLPSLKGRVRAVFPPGFESTSHSGKKREAYSFKPHHLLDTLNENRDSHQHVDDTIVNSAWYCKQKSTSAKHEFIVIQVSDLKIPGLYNWIALDRNQLQGATTQASSSAQAADAFRISYDGDLHRFLRECKLHPYLKLEEIVFQDNELPLLQLVSLVDIISAQHPTYHPFDTNCYWFTGLVWECMRGMFPGAQHTSSFHQGRRGKNGFVRHIPNPIQVRNILQEVQNSTERSNPELTQNREVTVESGENEVGGEIDVSELASG